MKKDTFLFIACFFILIALIPGGSLIPKWIEVLVCLSLILLIGIPHGAIDNVLFLSQNRTSTKTFFSVYIAAILFNILLWLVVPVTAYLIFLLISAFHFGQSQLVSYFSKVDFKSLFAYTTWGVSVLSGLIFFNQAEVNQLLVLAGDLDSIQSINNGKVYRVLYPVSTAAILLTLLSLWRNGNIKLEQLKMEVFTLVLIGLTFKLFSILIGFTLYFVILHSLRVMNQEFEFLKEKQLVRTIPDFIKMVTPLTSISIIGILFLSLLIGFGIINISYTFLILIIVSSITLPHVYVMDFFYRDRN